MTNTALRQAMTRNGITTRALATAVDVDPKSVHRWLTGRHHPQPEHRHRVCEVLGTEEAEMWPELFTDNLKIGPDREIVRAYPYRAAVGGDTWWKVIEAATTRIDINAVTGGVWLFGVPNMPDLLRARGEAGCEVRFLVASPDDPAIRRRVEIENVPISLTARMMQVRAHLEKLADVPNLAVRCTTDVHRLLGSSTVRGDDELLVMTHLSDRTGSESPTLHLRQRGAGLFDRFAWHVDQMWDQGLPL